MSKREVVVVLGKASTEDEQTLVYTISQEHAPARCVRIVAA